MKIEIKTLAIIGITSILLFLFISFIVIQVVQNSYDQIEEDEAIKSLEMAKKILFLEIGRLDMLASDWGERDDTYYFVKGNYSDYPEANLGARSLVNLNVNMILLFNSSGQLSYAEAVDLDTGRSAEVHTDLVEYIASKNKITSYSKPDDSVSGILNSPEGPLLISFQPITKNEYNGTTAGTLVLVRSLDPTLIRYFEDTIDLTIKIKPLDIATIPNASYISLDEHNNNLIASNLLSDIDKNPILSLVIEIPRNVHDLGNNTAKCLYFTILLIALTYSAVLAIAIERSVTSRLSKLDTCINDITVKGDHSSRIEIDGNDEIANLAKNINAMLMSLEDKEKLFKATIDSNGDGIIVVDNDKKIIVMNSKFADMLDLPVEMRIGEYICTIFDQILSRTNNADELDMKVKSIFYTSDSSRGILKYKNTHYYEWYSSPFIKNGIINGRVFCLHDITELKEIEGSLREAKIIAETSNRTKSEFLTNMSHELRTPLNSIIGFSDVLLEMSSEGLSEKQKRYVMNISKSGKHLLTLINDILDISKVESGKMHLYKENIAVKNLLEDMFSSLQPLAAEKEISMKVSLDPDLGYIHADRGKIKQVLYNLIGNAIKFTEHGGFVTISAKLNVDMLHISVKDTGIGISEEDQKKLFRPFTQIDSSISRKYEGTGLGLALSNELVALHGGRIWVESEPGKGSTFTFTIPVNGTKTSNNPI